jgi:hypothetical protein
MSNAWTPGVTRRPEDVATRDLLREALPDALRAPTRDGPDPRMWCLLEDDALALYIDRVRVVPGVDPAGRESTIDRGGALFRLCVGLRALGRDPRVELLPAGAGSDLLARVHLAASHTPTAADHALVEAITRRDPHSPSFADRAIEPHVLSLLLGAARMEGAWLGFVDAPRVRQSLSRIVAAADRWRRRRPGDTVVDRAATVAVLTTDGDARRDWLIAGQARARLILTARAAGLAVCCLREPVEVPLLRSRVSELVRQSGDPGVPGRRGGMPLEAVPQAVVCLGYAA